MSRGEINHEPAHSNPAGSIWMLICSAPGSYRTVDADANVTSDATTAFDLAAPSSTAKCQSHSSDSKN